MDLALPPMPFSAVAAPTGAAYLIVPEEMRNSASSVEIELPPGVVQVIVTWQGAEPLSVRHHRGDQMEVVHVIPSAASGVQRSTGVLTLASDEPHQIRIAHFSGRGDRWEQETLDQGYVAGIQVMPMGTAADITGGGSMLRVDNSVGTRVFLGDQMIFGDTGWRNIESLLLPGWTAGSASIRRVNDTVTLAAWAIERDETATTKFADSAAIPSGFSPTMRTSGVGVGRSSVQTAYSWVVESSQAWIPATLTGSDRSPPVNTQINASMVWTPTDNWPTVLPGIPG